MEKTMITDVEWTNESVVRLIEEYKIRPELWDKKHDLYRVQTAKYEAWSSIARIFDCDIADLRKKFNSILASHRREKAKIRAGGHSSWYMYPYLNFLSNHLEPPEKITFYANHSQDSHIESEQATEQAQYSDEDDPNQEDEEEEEDDEEMPIKQEPVVETYVRKKLPGPLRKSKRLTRTIRRRIVKEPLYQTTSSNHIDSKLLEMLKLLKKSEISKKKDECDTFGEYIAMSLRKHDERTQSMIKQAINNILFEQEMKKYSTGQYTTVVIESDQNPLILGEEGHRS